MTDLDSAFRAEVEARLKPRLELAARLGNAVQRYLEAERACIVADVIRVVAGRSAWVDQPSARERENSLAEIQAIVATIAPPAKPAEPLKRPIVRRAATLDEKKNASRLAVEASRVDPLEAHELLIPRIRMLVAEIRSLLTPLNPSDETYNTAYDALDHLRIVHRQSGARARVLGLDLAESQPWDDVAREARRALDRALDRVRPTTAPSLRVPLQLVAGRRR